MHEHVLNKPYDINEKILSYDVPIKSRRDLSEDEKNLIGDIRAGIKKKYKLFCWPMKGQLALQANNDKYEELFRRYEVFRRRYIYRSLKKPTCLVLEPSNTNFSILDLRKESLEKQKECVRNIASAESRETYNPEENAPLKIRVIIISDDRIVVLMKAYMHVNLPMSPFDMRRFVFFNMRIDSDSDFAIDEEKIENVNREVENRCHEYWRNVLKDIETPVIIPFASEENDEESAFYTIRKKLDKETVNKLNEYKMRKKASTECVLLYEFGQLFGEASGTKTPLFAIRIRGSFMHMMPCIVNIGTSSKEAYEDIVSQKEKYFKFDQCNFDETMITAGIDISQYFKVVLEFSDENNLDNKVTDLLKSINSGGVSEVSPRLEILVSFTDEEVIVGYTYDSAVVSEHLIEMIHESLLKSLEERFTAKEAFSWKAYIEDVKSREEQIEKLIITQKARYIKDAGFIASDDPEDYLALSTSATYGNYVVEDQALEAGQSLKNLGILLSGHIEERQADLEGILKTVSVYKAGYILGLESIAGINRSPFEYVAADDAKVLWLNSEELIEIMRKHPLSYEELMKRSILENQRLKKLWVLE